jgi:hypothetical protein
VAVRAFAAIRAAGVGGLATAAALAAHGGDRVVVDPLWLLAGLAGALAALAAARLCWQLVCRSGETQAPLPLPLLAAALLGAQLGAHWGLLAAGAPSHTGAAGSLALHAVFALAAALVVRMLEREVQRKLQARGVPHLRALDGLPRPPRHLPARPRPAVLPLGGRAPPEPA